MSGFRFATVGVPGAQGGTVVQGINNLGHLVGEYTVRNPSTPGSTGDPYPQAFVDTGGTITTIGPGGLPYGQNSSATGINNRGQIVGHSGHYETTARGFLYQGGQFTEIDAPGNTAFTTAFGINDFSQVVGSYLPFTSATGRSGFLWTSKGTFQDIAYPGSQSTAARGINDRGWIVGDYVASGGGNSHGFLDVNGRFQTIDAPGAVSTTAEGVNNLGEIVGTFYDGSHYHGFVDLQGKFDTIDAPGRRTPSCMASTISGRSWGLPRAARALPWMALSPHPLEGDGACWRILSPRRKCSRRTWCRGRPAAPSCRRPVPAIPAPCSTPPRRTPPSRRSPLAPSPSARADMARASG